MRNWEVNQPFRRGMVGGSSQTRRVLNKLYPDGVSGMAKPNRAIKKANHGKRPANAKARRAKRRLVRT